MGCVSDEPVITVWGHFGMYVCVESCNVYCSLCVSPLQMEILYSSYVSNHPKAVAVLTDNS